MSAVCPKCGARLVDRTAPCGLCVCDRRESAVKALVAAASSSSNASLLARVRSNRHLRNLGHSREEVLLARARAVDGCSVAEIVDGLVGDREAVGA
jgi:hypothetical protein